MNFDPSKIAFGAGKPDLGVRQRILVLTHSHPRLTRGGAEIAADSLVRGLRSHFNVEAFLLGCSFKPVTERVGLNLTQPFSNEDFVYQAPHNFDHFKFTNRDAKFPKMLSDLIDEIKPSLVHFHHYTVFGVEAFAIVKRARPDIKITLTLHEFLAICHNHGQMVKTKSLQLCDAGSPIACSQCFPELGPRDFFLRKAYIDIFLEYVDLFISPSQFLATRYIEWGLPKEKVIVLENVPPEPEAPLTSNGAEDQERIASHAKASTAGRGRIRIGFFGQMSPLKGVMVLLEAAKELMAHDVRNLTIEIFGDYSNQPVEFQNAVIKALEADAPNVRYHGPYDNSKVHRLMRSMDAIVVPSVWWENSPVVIQEALANGRPVICSDIGGMAEAVRPGLDGLWFTAGDSMSLAQVLMEIAHSPMILTRLSSTLRRPPSAESVVYAHIEVYRRLWGQAAAEPSPTNEISAAR